MSAEFHTEIEIKADQNSVSSLLELLKLLKSGKAIHFDSISLMKKWSSKYSEQVDLEKINNIILKGFAIEGDDQQLRMIITMDGPYGQFADLEETELFERIAEVVPNSYFEGYMSGCDYGMEQTLKGVLRNGKLKLYVKYQHERGEERGEKWDAVNVYDPILKKYKSDIKKPRRNCTLGEYIEMIKKSKMSYRKKIEEAVSIVQATVPYDDFLKAVGTSSDSFSMQDYKDLLWNYDLFGADYEAWCEFCGSLNFSQMQYKKLYNSLMSMKISV